MASTPRRNAASGAVPARQGMYDPAFEKDACGLAMVATLRGEPGHDIIDLALTAAPVVYSIFNAGSTPFVKAYIRKRAEVSEQVGSAFAIKRTFAFHTRDVLEFEVEILRLNRRQ